MARLETERLDLVPQTADLLDALIARDRARLEALTDARWPEPLEAPPLTEDALPYQRNRLRAVPPPEHWWGWVIVDRATGQAVGMLGLMGESDAGVVQLGYTIYPQFEGWGYATEAAQAVVSWGLLQPGVSTIRATIPPWHVASVRVAEKIGLRQTGTSHDDEVGEVAVFEVRVSRLA